MVKISTEVISRCYQYLNPFKEYELNFRNLKITELTNIALTNDSFGCLNFSDNMISEIIYLPQLNKLKTLIFTNNNISKIQIDFAQNCNNLKSLVLINNRISDFDQIKNISSCKSLEKLYLINNLVTKIKNYRLYVIYIMPNLKILDFQNVQDSEKKNAKIIFDNK